MSTIPALPKIFWAFAAITLLSGGASAQRLEADYDCVRGFNGRIERVHTLVAELRAENLKKAEFAKAAAKAAAEAGPGKIASALDTMRIEAGVGGDVHEYLLRHPNISVEFDTVSGLSSNDEIGGSVPLVTIRVNKTLPRTTKILAPVIAGEAFELMYGQMPESAEKAYMKASVMARVWLEMYNSAESLPVLDAEMPQYRNAELEGVIRSWVFKDRASAIRDLAAARKLPTLQEMFSKNEGEIEALRDAEAAYIHESYTTHHPDESLEPQMRLLRNARELHEQLETGLKIYKEFIMGVEFKDASGRVHNDEKGEEYWRLTNATLKQF